MNILRSCSKKLLGNYAIQQYLNSENETETIFKIQ